jgi:tetratricopeptide (TPR) repeat protein
VQGGFRAASLGEAAGAISSYRKALAMREALAAANPQDRDVRRELLRNHGKLGELLSGEGDLSAAIESSRRATRLAQELVTMPGATVEDRRNVATTLLSFGWMLARTPRVGDGVLFIRQSIAAFENLHRQYPNDLLIARNLALAYGRLGEALLEHTKDWAGALDANRKGFAVAAALLNADPRNNSLTKIVAYARLGIGTALYELEQPRAALAEQIRAMDMLRPMLDLDAKNETARYDTAYAMNEVSSTLIALGQLGPARTQLTEALGILSQSSALAETKLTDARVLLGVTYVRLGVIHALNAGGSSASRAQRTQACAQARRWFDLGEPILTAADTQQDHQWRYITRGPLEQMRAQAGNCTKPAPGAPGTRISADSRR